MRVIWKFGLNTRHSNEYGMFEPKMPKGAKVISAGIQNGDVTLWAIVDVNAPLEERKVHIVGTGKDFELKKNWEFINTVFQDRFVWHVFVEV